MRYGHESIRTPFDECGHLFPSLDENVADTRDATFNDALDAQRTHTADSEVVELGRKAGEIGA